MITRTFSIYEAKAMRVEWKDGKPIAKEIGKCTFEGTTPSLTTVRKAMRNQGIEIKRGDKIDISKVSERILGMDEEVFARYAQEVSRAEQQG